MTNIILTTMVRNESRILRRMLDSTVGVADRVVLVDTGSTDDTVQVAKAAEAARGRPILTYSTPWVDFGTSRTRTLEQARNAVIEWGLDPASTWLLLLDADMELQNEEFRPEHASCALHALRQVTGGMSYWNRRLLRADVDAHYEQPTHEYLVVPDSAVESRLDTLWIKDRDDGGCKADKFPRDEQLLRAYLKQHPGNPRAMFYLANTLKAMGEYRKASNWYKKRIKAGGWDEEVWASRYYQAQCLRALGLKELAKKAFLEAWGDRPWRAEPLYALAQFAAAEGDHARAVQFCNSLPKNPKEDKLFVETEAYGAGADRIRAIHGFYCGEIACGRAAADRLVLREGSTDVTPALAQSTWYTEKLPTVTDMQVPFQPEPGWHTLNPSVMPTFQNPFLAPGVEAPHSFVICVRTVNYTINPDGSYSGFGDAVCTRNFLQWVDPELRPEGNAVELQGLPGEETGPVQGLEDVRLYAQCTGEIRGLCTSLRGGHPRIWDVSWDPVTGELKSASVLSPERRCEKNWLPFQNPLTGEVLAVYGHRPLALFDLQKKLLRVVANGVPLGWDFSTFRGGAAPVPWNGGWLWVVHQVTTLPGMTRRTYIHRFVWADASWRICGLSRPWHFQARHTIEFCSGAALRKGGLMLTYGVNDADARIAVCAVDTVNKAIHALEEF